MTKLEEFSNPYLTVYASNKRLVFDFKYPRLYERDQRGAFSFGSLSNQVTGINGLTNFFPPEDRVEARILAEANPRNTTFSYSGSGMINPQAGNVVTVTTNPGGTAGQILNLSGTSTANTITISNPPKDVVDIKRLVISSRTSFGRVYMIDSGDRVVRVNGNGKALENPYTVQEMLRFFGQFNPHVTKLAAAAILPKHKIVPEEIAKFENLIYTLNAVLGENSAQGYIWSFMFPVLNDCKYYEWSYQDRGIVSTMITKSSSINNTPIYKNLKKCKSLMEFFKVSFGVKGSAFIKKIMSLAKGKKETVAALSETYHKMRAESNNFTEAEEMQINQDLLNGRQLGTFPQNETARHLQVFTEVIFGKDSGLRGGKYGYASYQPFKTPFKVEEFHHLGPIRMLELFKDLIPIDYWFNLDSVPDSMYSIVEPQSKTIREWLTKQNDGVRKKVFLSINNISELVDTITQLNRYANVEDIPEDLRSIYPNGLKTPARWSTITELHDMVSREYNQIKTFATNRKIKYARGLDKMDGLDFGGGFTSELPKDTARIVEYGALLKHCVAGYADRCADNNETIILSVNKDGKPHFTLELRRTTQEFAMKNEHALVGTSKPANETAIDEDHFYRVSRYAIHQFKGLQNKVPTVNEVYAILKGLKETKIVSDIHEPSRYEVDATGNRIALTLPEPVAGTEITIRNEGERELVVRPGNGLVVGDGYGYVAQNALDGNNIVLNNHIVNLQDQVIAVNGIAPWYNDPPEVPPQPPIAPAQPAELEHLMRALQDPAQHDNIYIRDQDGVLANAANNNE